MKRPLLSLLFLIVILSFLLPASSAFAQSKSQDTTWKLVYSEDVHIPSLLSTNYHPRAPKHAASQYCILTPNDANCDGQWPDISSCWDNSAYIVHTSGWINAYGGTMGISLYRSGNCRSDWAYGSSACNCAYWESVGIVNTTDAHSWWSSMLNQSYIWSPISYVNGGEHNYADAHDGINNTYHGTPTYTF